MHRAEGTDIMPFADVLPLTQRPALQPLPPRQALQQALALRPGKINLAEVSYSISWQRSFSEDPHMLLDMYAL